MEKIFGDVNGLRLTAPVDFDVFLTYLNMILLSNGNQKIKLLVTEEEDKIRGQLDFIKTLTVGSNVLSKVEQIAPDYCEVIVWKNDIFTDDDFDLENILLV